MCIWFHLQFFYMSLLRSLVTQLRHVLCLPLLDPSLDVLHQHWVGGTFTQWVQWPFDVTIALQIVTNTVLVIISITNRSFTVLVGLFGSNLHNLYLRKHITRSLLDTVYIFSWNHMCKSGCSFRKAMASLCSTFSGLYKNIVLLIDTNVVSTIVRGHTLITLTRMGT